MREKLILDFDNTMGLRHHEVDDGLVLLYLLGRPELEVLGITTTFGNGTISEVDAQTDWLLRRLDKESIPVFSGAPDRQAEPTEAAQFLAETVAAHPGQVSILAVGPVGNLHAAAKLDPAFFTKVKRIACMGGYLEPLRLGRQNVGELNLSGDPEASLALLAAPCSVTIMSAQICLQAAFGLPDIIRTMLWPQWLRSAVVHWLATFWRYTGEPRFYLWDLLPAVSLSFPEVFEERSVSCDSTLSDMEQGLLVLRDGQPNGRLNVPSQVRAPGRLKRIIFDAWNRGMRAPV
jgi:inosine-uridine nucleoside N-ribohydrolase